jgi:hypothetical protein
MIFALPFLLFPGHSRAQAALNAPIMTLDDDACANLKRTHVMKAIPSIGCDRLRIVKVRYLGFDNLVHEDGVIMVLDVVAPQVVAIFQDLLKCHIPVAKVKLMNDYDGIDEASMADNNTSSFNDRDIASGNKISLHAFGAAIDINPIQNPYLKKDGGTINVSPKTGIDYINRSEFRPWKNIRQGMAETMVDIFANHGFTVWGGYWNDPIDYQHFQVSPKVADMLMSSSYAVASSKFTSYVRDYHQCLKHKRDNLFFRSEYRRQCIERIEKEM